MSRPEDRYVELTTKVLKDGRIVYNTAIPRTIATDELMDPTFHAHERVRMDIIANNVFGSPYEWWRIAAANKRVDGSLHVLPGTKLVIPRNS